MLIVIVGSFGLASNFIGLLLFHGKYLIHLSSHTLISLIPEHGHSHGTSPPKAAQIHTPQSGSLHHHPIPTPHDPIVIPTRSRSPSYSDFSSSLYGHPVATRASLVQTAHEIASGTSPTIPHRSLSLRKDSSAHAQPPVLEQGIPSTESTPLLPQSSHNHSHSHAGSMNMRALVLHVIGDALGNVGVIATGLIIWLTDWPYKYYCDPIISLVITIIIFSSALPLGKPLSTPRSLSSPSSQSAALLSSSSKVSLPMFPLTASAIRFSKSKASCPSTNCTSGNSPNPRSSPPSTFLHPKITTLCPSPQRFARHFIIMASIQAPSNQSTFIQQTWILKQRYVVTLVDFLNINNNPSPAKRRTVLPHPLSVRPIL